MTITKTSQKFVQINDVMIYGLGFNSEPELNKVNLNNLDKIRKLTKKWSLIDKPLQPRTIQFVEKFQELKEATRNAAQKPGGRQNGVHAGSTSQQSNIIAPPSSIATSTGATQTDTKSDFTREMLINATIKQPLAIHQRSQSLSGLQLSKVLLVERTGLFLVK